MIIPISFKNQVNTVLQEYNISVLKFPNFNTCHEGYAVIKEELEELWAEVKKRPCGNRQKMKKEASHVAAMAIRFMVDLCDY